MSMQNKTYHVNVNAKLTISVKKVIVGILALVSVRIVSI